MRSKISCTLLIAVAALFLSSCSDKPVPPAEVPEQVKTFVTKNFPGQAISYAEKDWSWFSYEYEVTLADGTHVQFDRSNAWTKIECPATTTGVPVALLPPAIATYLSTNNPGVAVKKIDKDSRGYEVELANDLEFKFNEQGALTEMDD